MKARKLELGGFCPVLKGKRFTRQPGLLSKVVTIIGMTLLPMSAQEWKELYDPLEVRSLYLTVDSGDWSSVVNDQPEEGQSASQTRASAMFNGEGEAPIQVEIRRKGATDPVLTAGGLTKVSLKIDFNAIVPGQTWNGVRKLSLEIGGEGGPLGEGFAWQIHRMAAEAGYYKYDAANAAWVKLYVNGNFHGVYTSTEQRDEEFMKNRDIYSETGTWLYKVDGSTGLETGIGNSPTFDHLNFAPFVKSKGNTPPAPDLEIDLPQWIDMESMLTLGACNAYVENADELFKNNGKNSFAVDFLPPNERLRQYYPWDLDSSIKQGTDTVFGIANPIFDEPWFQRVYQHTLREMIEGPLSAAKVHPFIDDLASVLGPELASDPFISSGTSSVTALKNWITTRNASVLGQLTLPYVARPTFNHPGGEVVSGFSLAMNAPEGAIYYTTDGSDPRLPGGSVSGSAALYAGPVAISSNTNIVARTLSAGNWSGLSSKVAFQIASYGTDLRITEIMYHPKDPNPGDTIDPEEYEFIELQNTGAGPLDLSGFYFDGFNYLFPPGSIVASGDFVVLVRNSSAFTAEYPGVTPDGVYLGGLKNGGEKIRLHNANGTAVISVDYNDDPPWVISPDGMGYSLVNRNLDGDPDDAANWSASSAPGGSPGAADPTPGYSTSIRFNEVLADGQGVYEDAVELINLDTMSHNIGDWYLSDDARDVNGDLDPALLKKFRIPAGTMIGAGGFAAFFDNDYGAANPLIPFGLSSFGERVYLSSADGGGNLTGHVIALEFPATDPNVSYGRVGTSNGTVEARLQSPTFGVDSPASVADFRSGNGEANSAPKVEPVVISEIMYNPLPSGSEFVELHNVSGSSVDLSGWDIDGISGFEFPAGTILPAGGFVILADSATTTAEEFRSNYGVPASVPIFVSGFDLGNSGEGLNLEKPNPTPLEPDILIERIRYNDKAPWPTEANGSGPSLERLPPDSFGMEPLNWKTPSVLGTPGTLGSAQTGLAIAQGSFWDYLASASTPATNWMDPGYNATAWPSTVAPAGYGDPLVVGTIPYGPDPASRYLTTYFRKSFSISGDLSNIGAMEFSYLFDDGIVVYLNGVEIFRDGMPGGSVFYTTPASADINATTHSVVDLTSAIGNLVQGTNVIAVELHQSGPVSTDLVWDAGLSYSLVVDANDLDNDGMDAAWEAANGLDDTDPGDAILDSDGDRQSNLAEFIAGTDPNDPNSVFRISGMAPTAEGWTVTWDSVPGKTYRVHYSGDLENWSTYGAIGEMIATESSTQFSDPSALPPPSRFYRVEVVQ